MVSSALAAHLCGSNPPNSGLVLPMVHSEWAWLRQRRIRLLWRRTYLCRSLGESLRISRHGFAKPISRWVHALRMDSGYPYRFLLGRRGYGAKRAAIRSLGMAPPGVENLRLPRLSAIPHDSLTPDFRHGSANVAGKCVVFVDMPYSPASIRYGIRA